MDHRNDAGVVATSRDLVQLRALVAQASVRSIARDCLVAPNTLLRVLAAQPVHRSTLHAIRSRLAAELEARS